MAIGLDFDGTVRKLPFPLGWFMKNCHPKDILERSKLHFIKEIVFQMVIHFPVILDGKLIEKLRGKKIIVISGRREKTERMEKKLNRYLKVARYYWRRNCKIYEEIWKLKWIRFEDLDVFYEDRKFVIDYLRKAGIKVIEI